MNAKRTLTSMDVHYISLVATPANGKGLVLKTGDGTLNTFEILKTDDERMIAYGIVYAPDEVDSQGDTASSDVIRKAAYRFMREGRAENIDVDHSFDEEEAYVAESWLIRKNDALFPDEADGAWAVGIQVCDIDIWKQLKNGALTGISLAGCARAESTEERSMYTEKYDAPHWFSSWWGDVTKKKEAMMDKDAVKEFVQVTVDNAVQKAMKKVMKKSGDKDADGTKDGKAEDDTPVTKGELTTIIEDVLAKAAARGSHETGAKDTDDKDYFV